VPEDDFAPRMKNFGAAEAGAPRADDVPLELVSTHSSAGARLTILLLKANFKELGLLLTLLPFGRALLPVRCGKQAYP
jgi:hypothetical protein